MFVEPLVTTTAQVDVERFASVRNLPGTNFGRDTDYREENFPRIPSATPT